MCTSTSVISTPGNRRCTLAPSGFADTPELGLRNIKNLNVLTKFWYMAADIHTHVCNAATLVWGSLRLAPITLSATSAFTLASKICKLAVGSLVPVTKGRRKGAPGVYCLCMCQVPMVICILLRYTKITNFSLPAERSHCRAMLLVGHNLKDFKSEIISL